MKIALIALLIGAVAIFVWQLVLFIKDIVKAVKKKKEIKNNASVENTDRKE